MKIKRSRLQQLIKEEVEHVMTEIEVDAGPDWSVRDDPPEESDAGKLTPLSPSEHAQLQGLVNQYANSRGGDDAVEEARNYIALSDFMIQKWGTGAGMLALDTLFKKLGWED